jgi:hypothetical protein
MIIIYLMLNNPSGLFGISLKRVVHSLMIAYASFTSPNLLHQLVCFQGLCTLERNAQFQVRVDI